MTRGRYTVLYLTLLILTLNLGLANNQNKNGLINERVITSEESNLTRSDSKVTAVQYTPLSAIIITGDSDFGPSGYNFPGIGTALDPYRIEGYSISDSGYLISVSNTNAYFKVQNNLLDGVNAFWSGIVLNNVDHCTIESNYLQNCYDGIVTLGVTPNLSIINNTILGSASGSYMLSLYQTIGVNIINNTLIGGSQGINLFLSNDSFIYNNTLLESSTAGIYSLNSHTNIFQNNTVFNNRYGMYFTNSLSSLIEKNYLFSNLNYSFYLNSGSFHNNIQDNNLTNNNQGISSQAKDDGFNNSFQRNYWSEWTSPDVDEDGYVDLPYSLNGSAGNSDQYPISRINSTHPPDPPIEENRTINPILINDNEDFGPSGYDFPGNGTPNFPYRIENYSITNSTTSYLLSIFDTSVHFIIRNNTLNGINSSTSGILLSNVYNGKVIDNVIYNCKAGVSFDSTNNGTVENNVINNCSTGIIISGSTSKLIIVTGNNIQDSQIGVKLQGTGNHTVSSNRIHNMSLMGIYVFKAENNTFQNNSVSKTIGRSIFIWISNRNILANNTVFDSNNVGVQIEESNFTTVEFNTIYQCKVFGIWLVDRSSWNDIRYNVLYRNSDKGIAITTFEGGICRENTVRYNDLIGNESPQVSDSGINNVFEYNFYDDWTTPDDSNDGYIDLTYLIGGTSSNSDAFPLKSPFNPTYLHYLTRFQVINLNEGQTISESFLIQWTPAIDSQGHTVSYTVYFDNQILADGITTTNYDWDTTSIDNLDLKSLRIMAVCSEGLDGSTNDLIISINNIITTSSSDTTTPVDTSDTTTPVDTSDTTTVINTSTTPDQISNWSFTAIFGGFLVISLILRRKKN